jgi:hypothetical protein
MAEDGIDECGPCDSRGSFSLFRPKIIDAFVSECAAYIANSVGPSHIAGIFLCGSFALGEGGISFDSKKPQLISDMDLLVVLNSFDALNRFRKKRIELGRSCEKLTERIEFAGRVDIGMMLPEDLERMPPRPGVFDLKVHGRTLFGAEETLDLIPDYEAAQIGGREAVILLENRIASLLGRYGTWIGSPDDFPYLFIYEIARVYTDIATALISLSGLYIPGYEKRAELFARAARKGDLAVSVDPGLTADISSWTRFKLRPSKKTISGFGEGGLRGMWDEAARKILGCWRACEAHVQGKELAARDVSCLLADRRTSGSKRVNLIGWREYLAGKPLGSRMRCLTGLGRKILERDPSAYMREMSVRLLDRYIVGDIDRTSERVPGLFRRTWRSREEAAKDVFSGWRETLYGQEDA